MGLEEQLPGGILLSTLEKVAGYVRKGSLWPATFGLACCAIEMMATAGPRFDIARFGMEPTPQPVGGGRFPVKYYITAMLFIVFDIEIIFLYPWAVHFDAMKFFGLVEMVIFIATVFVAYTYVWRRGGLDWD